MPAKYTMTISRLTVDKLGVRLYDKVSAVLAELVANSYDADATLVRLVFRNPHGDDAELEIVDDGHGMGRDILLGPWLEPATAFKTGGSDHPMARWLIALFVIGIVVLAATDTDRAIRESRHHSTM